MDDANEEKPNKGLGAYPLWFSLLILLIWLTGLGLFLLFGFFAVITLLGSSYMIGTWNLLVTLAEGWVLFLAARHIFGGAQPRSVPLLWATLAGIGVPLIAAGGCTFMADSLRIAG